MNEIALPSWKQLWGQFSAEEQGAAISMFMLYMQSEEESESLDTLLDKLARAVGFRPQSIRKLSSESLEKKLLTYAATVLSSRMWGNLFFHYYKTHRRDLMCRFLDQLNITHDGEGYITSEIGEPGVKNVENATTKLLDEYSPHEIARYYGILLLQNSAWVCLGPQYKRLVTLVQTKSEPPQRTAHPEPLPIKDGDISQDTSSSKFTTLDRVLIDQIIRTVSDGEGCLAPDSLADLIDTVVSLNEGRQWSYFHLGFMDAMVPGRDLSFDRPEYNDERRGWYLTGVLAAYARKRDPDRLKAVLKEQEPDFTRVASSQKGAGAILAKYVFSFFVETGCLTEATLMLRRQLKELGPRLVHPALHQIGRLIRDNNIPAASLLLGALREQLPQINAEPQEQATFARVADRRLGQCLQAKGDFGGARRAFERLLANEPQGATSELLADIGLVSGKFRSLAEVRIPDDPDRRATMRDALERGEVSYQQAVDQYRAEAPNANYALAVLNYLRYRDCDGNKSGDVFRDRAIDYVQQAVSAIHGSSTANAYEEMGILGRCLFIQAILQMERLDPVDAKAGMDAWRQITSSAGVFPKRDISRLLEAANVIDERLAVEIAESIWRYRKNDVLDVITNGRWIVLSAYLRRELLQQAREEKYPRSLRWRLWSWLVPAFLNAEEIDAAEEGLDAMVMLADDPSLAEKFVTWLSDRANYDPAWKESEAMWTRARCYRMLGKATECANELRSLFFLVQDSALEAEHILEVFEEYRIDQSLYADLLKQAPRKLSHAVMQSLERRLKQGEGVSILFIGGNELQEKYDSDIHHHLGQEWPGVKVDFRHTGWSSNWGRDLHLLLIAGNKAESVVLMDKMRTMLGRRLRAGIKKPWIPCTSTGKAGMLASIKKAVLIGLEQRGKS